jgi:hypothetical protein
MITAGRMGSSRSARCCRSPHPPTAHAAKRADPAKLSARAKQDAIRKIESRRVFAENFDVYGVRKVWQQLRREGEDIARCTVERLMRSMGLQGVMRGKPVKCAADDPETREGALGRHRDAPDHDRQACGPRHRAACRSQEGCHVCRRPSRPGVLLIGAAARLRATESAGHEKSLSDPSRLLVAVLCVLVALALAGVVLLLPDQGPSLAPQAMQHLPETGLGNPVTAVLIAYRAFDTMLEKVVLVLAVVGVWSLAADRYWGGAPGEAREQRRVFGWVEADQTQSILEVGQAMFGRQVRAEAVLPHSAIGWSGVLVGERRGYREPPRVLDDGACRLLAAGSMTGVAALPLFNSVDVTVSTICRISFVCAQARIETE